MGGQCYASRNNQGTDGPEHDGNSSIKMSIGFGLRPNSICSHHVALSRAESLHYRTKETRLTEVKRAFR